ncbi:MAG: phage integrase SAM-like domain-containing protein [Mameliella sp.]|nr:phage integrase SAM-like domain-containing protein [Phaeodactylibacter sp.]
MGVRYYLRNKSEKPKTLIVGAYSIDAKTFIFSTGVKIRPRHFSHVTKRIKGSAIDKDAINMRLERFAREVPILYERLFDEYGYVSKDKFKEGISELRGKKRRGLSVSGFLEMAIQEGQESGHYSESSIKMYQTLMRDLKSYGETRGEVNFQDLDYSWFMSFRDYLYRVLRQRTGGGADNTIRKKLETLKMFLNDATRRGFNDNLDFKAVDMKTLRLRKTPSDTTYLTDDEIDLFYQADLGDYPSLERVRDCFIVACLTGARHGDWEQITNDNIQNVEGIPLLTFYAKKTGSFCVVPVRPIVREVLDKYDGRLPVISNQKSNAAIKRAGRLAGLINPTSESKIIKGRKDIKTEPKYKFLTTHTARRTLVTTLRGKGYTFDEIAILTGHKGRGGVVQQYDKAGKIDKAVRIGRHMLKK